MNSDRTIPWYTICCLLVLAGCGRNGLARVAVEGTVEVDGRPLADGTILFVPIAPTQGPKSGATIHAGRFAIDEEIGPSIGAFRVEVSNEATDWAGYSRSMHDASRERIDILTWTTTVETTTAGPNHFHLEFTTR